MYYSRSMGVKGTDLVLETQYPTKNDTQKATTDSNKAKAVAASHDELLDDDSPWEELLEANAISRGIQSQLAE